MADNMADTMTDKQKDLLSEAYGIITAFQDMMTGDILEKTGTLYMSRDYQDLGTACALIAEAMGGQPLPVRVIQKPETREKLKSAYQAVHMMMQNAAPKSQWQDCCASLMACIYTPLNMSASPDGMQAALESVVQAAQIGLDTLGGLDSMGPLDSQGWYMNPAGETYEKRRGQLHDAFSMLIPRDTENGNNEKDGDDHETA